MLIAGPAMPGEKKNPQPTRCNFCILLSSVIEGVIKRMKNNLPPNYCAVNTRSFL